MAFNGHIQARFTVPSSQSIETTSTGGGTDTVNLTATSYYLGNAGSSTPAFIAAFQTLLQAVDATWTVSLSTTTGKVSNSCEGTWSSTWTSTNLRHQHGFTANNSSDRTVSGLATGSTERRVNGASSGEERTTGGDFTVVRVAGDTTRDVVIPVTPGLIRAYPASGTVVRSMKVTLTRGVATTMSTRREVVTYNGSDTAVVEITRDGRTITCTVVLRRGRVSCPAG
jgi:hypothetical protein